MRRPKLLTVVACIIGYLGVGALILAVVAPRFAELGMGWWWIRAACLVYAATALPTAFGLWRRRGWAVRSYKLWVAGAVFAGLTPTIAGAGLTDQWMAPIGAVLLGCALWLLVRPIQRRLEAAG